MNKIAGNVCNIVRKYKYQNKPESPMEIEAFIYEHPVSKKRIISFGWPWEYSGNIYDYPKPGAKPGIRGSQPSADKCEDRFILDAGSSGCEIWLEAEEARRIFTWAKPYMVGEKGGNDE